MTTLLSPGLSDYEVVEDAAHIDAAMRFDSMSEGGGTELLECGCKAKGRALIVCFDGTSNQFNEYNTNVIELYDRIVKNDQQLTYYSSGIGTYAKPSWRSFGYWKKALTSTIDLAIAWDFEKILLRGYRWLSANYRPGDRIYLFGFSRGAYQIRTLAAMIDKVGLILPGNEEQIPFAYEIYADRKSDEYEKYLSLRHPHRTHLAALFEKRFFQKKTKKYYGQDTTFNMATRFKETFSRPGVRVHYIGVWDTVSSIGVTRKQALPFVNQCEHFCYMRHALALDERRVKFLPEYACGGASYSPEPDSPLSTTLALDSEGDKLVHQSPTRPRVKEVWFVGSHSDIGGGIKSNKELNNASIPALWMGNEAMMAGLDLTPARATWDLETVKKVRPTESLGLHWRIAEIFPLKRLSYKSKDGVCWRPHMADPRIITPGQKIHASVAFVDGYQPRARFSGGDIRWSDIIGKGDFKQAEWANTLGDVLELDSFDLLEIPNIMNMLGNNKDHMMAELLERLAFMANNEAGARAISSDEKFPKLLELSKDEHREDVRIGAQKILSALAGHGYSVKFSDHGTTTQTILSLILQPDAKLQQAGLQALNLVDPPSDSLVAAVFHLVVSKEGESNANTALALEWLTRQGGFADRIPQHIDISVLVENMDRYIEAKSGDSRAGLDSRPTEPFLGSNITAAPPSTMVSDNLNTRRGAITIVPNIELERQKALLERIAQILGSERQLDITCCRFLGALSNHRSTHPAIIRAGIIPKLIDIMQTGDLFVRYYAKETLSRFLVHDTLRDNAVECSLIESIAQILRSAERPSHRRTLSTGTHSNVPRSHYIVDGGTLKTVSGGTFIVVNGNLEDVSGGTFIVFGGTFKNVTGGDFIVYGGDFQDVTAVSVIASGGSFTNVRGGQFLVSGGYFSKSSTAEFSRPDSATTLNSMAGGLQSFKTYLLPPMYTHFNGLKELVERLASFEESRARLLRVEVITSLVGLIGTVGVATFPKLLEHDDILAGMLRANAISEVVLSIRSKGLAQSEHHDKTKLEILAKLADHDSKSLRLVASTIREHLPVIRQTASQEVVEGLEELLNIRRSALFQAEQKKEAAVRLGDNSTAAHRGIPRAQLQRIRTLV